MKILGAVVLSCCLLAATFAFAQVMEPGFEMARVVAFDHVAANAQHMENSDQYKISMRLGNTIYACRGSGPASTFIDWSINKEFPAMLQNNGKAMLVKSPNGEVVTLTVTGKKQAK
jgi:hypothetical protein